ncbi:unnamed protein product [Allacma fusca]|uniref:J domain-containing protein n=1 Tax=Allacma fusca TaxID=39272 RepID=A0A8J2LS13_9HEXA|nr:unnamed protein product [Allacma fusca]
MKLADYFFKSYPLAVAGQGELDCETLQVSENCDEGQVRSAFIKLAKKYHPDGGGAEADAVKFNQVDAAYKNMLKKFADERHNQHKVEGEYGLYYETKKKKIEEEAEKEEEDIKHTAPQHRNYLSYGGFGFGSPSTREKQYQKYRAVKAVSNVHEHRVQQAIKDNPCEETSLVKDKRAAKKIMTSFGMDRMVEDMIQESMARGEFNNLSGQEKEIRQEMTEIRETILKRRHKYEETLTASDKNDWQRFLQDLKPTCDQLNVKIQKYNLLVPTIHKQIFCVQLDREAAKAISKFTPEVREVYLKSEKTNQKTKNLGKDAISQTRETFMGYLMSVLQK